MDHSNPDQLCREGDWLYVKVSRHFYFRYYLSTHIDEERATLDMDFIFDFTDSRDPITISSQHVFEESKLKQETVETYIRTIVLPRILKNFFEDKFKEIEKYIAGDIQGCGTTLRQIIQLWN